MFLKLSIKLRLAIIVGVSVLGFVILGADALIENRRELVSGREHATRNLVEAAISNIERLHRQVTAGELTEDQAQRLAIESVRAARYGEDDYFFIIDGNVRIVMHPFNSEIEGRDGGTVRDPDGVALFTEMVRAARDGGGYVHYRWTRDGSNRPLPKISYAAAFDPWNWVVATGVYVDDIDAAFWAKAQRIGLIVLIVTLASAGIAYLASVSISRSVAGITTTMRRLAQGETGLAIPFRDLDNEIGHMAQAIEVFRGDAVERLRLEEDQKQAEAKVDAERRKALLGVLHELVKVAVDGNEAQILMVQMKRDVSETVQQVHTMASSVEEMRAAVGEIARNSETATTEAQASEESAGTGRQMAGNATAAMDQMTRAVNTAKIEVSELAAASDQIGDIVKQIERIAAQTNLLALNATIEAARAGDAGKGFAVVASEVKALANQTARATEDIRGRIANVRGKVEGIIAAMDESVATVGTGRSVVDGLAGSLEEIGRNVNSVSSRMAEIAGVLTQQTAASQEVARSASTVSDIARKNATEIDGVLKAMDTLSRSLNTQVGTFSDLGDLAIIEIAKNDHAMFKKSVIDAVAGNSDITADDLPDHHNCKLGRWYDTAHETIRRLPAYAGIREPHKRVHDAGKTVLRLLRDNRQQDAIDALAALNDASHEVLGLLTELSNEVQALRTETAA